MKRQESKLYKIVKVRSKCRRLVNIILCGILLINMFSGISFIQPKKAEAEEKILSNPRIVPDSSMEAGQNVTWDCIWFGSYPQAEVVPDNEEYTALAKELLQSGDLTRDNVLYQTLQSATGWDEQGDIVIDGNKYRRIKKEDATYIPYALTSSNYQWKNETEYHYFKYQPIKWRVLSVNGSKAFLLADKVLDDKQYHTKDENVTWEGSTIRSWLNGYNASANIQNQDYSSGNFIDTAFGTYEKQAIKETYVKNKDNFEWDTDGGNNTHDKVFLLSGSETYKDKYGFVCINDETNESNSACSSVYAKAMGTYSGIFSDGYAGNCWWWLRSPGYNSRYASGVEYDGFINQYSMVNNPSRGVRPALNLNLAPVPDAASSNLWSYAGTVCSDGTVEDAISED